MGVLLVSMGPSDNPTSQVDPTDKRFNLTREKDPTRKPRRYYVCKFKDPEDPFGPLLTRVISQNYNSIGEPFWRGGDPKDVEPFLGKEIPGAIVRRDVEKYFVPSINGKVVLEGIKGNYAASFTAVVLKSETAEQVFTSRGRKIVEVAEKIPSNAAPVPVVPPLNDLQRKVLSMATAEQ